MKARTLAAHAYLGRKLAGLDEEDLPTVMHHP
jgi:hypothetical protein